MQPRRWVAAPALLLALALTGCGVGASATSPPPRTVTGEGYALAMARTPAGPVALHLNLLISGSRPTSTWQTLAAAVTAAEHALVAAGAPADSVGVGGAPSLSSQVGPSANEASQTVIATLPSASAALAVASRLETSSLAGYDGSYLVPTSTPALSTAAETAADRTALAMAKDRAERLAAAQGRRLGALLNSSVHILASEPCGPVSGCASATGDMVPTAGPGQVVLTVTATYATTAG